MNTKNIILSVVLSVSLLSVAGLVAAAEASLYISPSSSTITAGSNINASGSVATAANKVCVAKGTITFTNATCQSITVANGLTTQTSPTCASPNFTIGIPQCTSVDKVLFTISAKAPSIGTASINLTNVNVIGVGVSVGLTGKAGVYTISSVPPPAPTTTPAPVPSTVVRVSPHADNPARPSGEVATTTAQETPSGFVAQTAALVNAGMTSSIMWIVVLLLIVGLVGYILYRRNQKKKDMQK